MATASDSFDLFLNDTLPMLRSIEGVLAIVGLLYVGKVSVTTICDLVIGLRAHFYSKLWNKKLIQRYGKWAVVTGCTDGIGKAYSEELAKEGVNIVLISRNMEKLQKVASDLGLKYKIETSIVQVDFSDGKEIYEKVSHHLADKDIGILVNNVGTMLPYPKHYNDVTEEEIWSHINVNMGSVTAMTKIVLPKMIKAKKGAIVNIASIAASGPIPLMGIYSASKVFVDYFSQALEWEYKGKGLTIQTLIPSYVATNMISFSATLGSANFVTPTPSKFAAHALSTLGYTSRTTGYWVHGIQAWFVEKIFSRSIFIYLMGYAQKFFLHEYKHSHKL